MKNKQEEQRLIYERMIEVSFFCSNLNKKKSVFRRKKCNKSGEMN